MKNVFDANDLKEIFDRIEKLSPNSQGTWGKMSVDQMLAHLNVAYEMAFQETPPKSNFIKKFLLKKLIKPMIVSEKSYKKNSPTSSAFKISKPHEFAFEKQRLIDFMLKTLEKGPAYFEGKESASFGKLTSKEWNNLFFKHLDHHLQQFGV